MPSPPAESKNLAHQILAIMERASARIWTAKALADETGAPKGSIATTLSRLTIEGMAERTSRGRYRARKKTARRT